MLDKKDVETCDREELKDNETDKRKITRGKKQKGWRKRNNMEDNE